ncbi:MAG: xanthine dehydrogenase family protein [Deltaproteobacteria bacterium]|nr:xanthine dehydrogenase family protein [Deltaproteobacteria bacterium]
MYKVIGRHHIRKDGAAKVTGKAKFTADLHFPNCLYAAIRHSEHAHARIKGIDIAPALQMNGVAAVITGNDFHSNKWGNVIQDMPFLANDRVRYLGDAVVAVAAETLELARNAAQAVRIEYEPLPAIFDPSESLAGEAPLLGVNDNTVVRHHTSTGDVQKSESDSDEVVDLLFETPFIEHSYLEPEAAWAVPDQENGVTVYLSTQHPYSARRAVAQALGLDLNEVTIIQPPIGGGFGGKDDNASLVAARAAMLAAKTGRPVKLVLTREESFLESYKRHPYKMHYRLGARKDGTFTFLQAEIIADAGAYASMSPFVTWRSAVQAAGPYRFDSVWADMLAVYTNNTYTGAMRGFGSPQVCFAVESAVDELASKLKIDPVRMRLNNVYRQGDVTPTGQVLGGHVVSLTQVLERAARKSGWPGPNTGSDRALGIACSYRGVSLGAEGADQCYAVVTVSPDGSVDLAVGVAENGQGLNTAMALIAAEALGCNLDRVRVHPAGTHMCPDGGPTVASRGTIAGGNAVLDAALKIRAQMDKAAQRFDAGNATFEELAGVCDKMKVGLSEVGHWSAPPTSWDGKTGKGDAYFTWVYGCQVADVRVDVRGQKVRVERVTAVHDLGKVIYPQGAKGQVTGGVVMGLGYALMEDAVHEQGRLKSYNFDRYKIPRTTDAPVIDVEFIENPDKAGPFGAKSLGEPTCEITAPAIANAIARAVGARVVKLPITPERIRQAIAGGDYK